MTKPEHRNRIALNQTAEVNRIFGAIKHGLAEKTPASLLVTSASTGEGKSLCASAIAAAAALAGAKVIAMDLNWHRPAMHRFFEELPRHSTQEIADSSLSALVSRPGGLALDVLFAPPEHDSSRTRVSHDTASRCRI